MAQGDSQHRFSSAMADVLAMIAVADGTGLSAESAVAIARVLGVDGVGVRVVAASRDGEPIWGCGELSAPLDDLELTLGEGPIVDALSGAPVLVADLSKQQHWLAYGPAAIGLGARAIFTFPLRVGAITIGVLTAYRRASGSLTGQQVADALILAESVALLLLDPDAASDGRPPRWLSEATPGRARVHQATGMVSVQLGVCLAEALARIRAHAFGNDLPIDTVAADIVARRLRFTDRR